MKRIFSILIVLVLVALFALPAFAATLNYPTITLKDNFVIRESNGTYFLHTFNSFTTQSFSIVLHGDVSYVYQDDMWKPYVTHNSDFTITNKELVYSSITSIYIENPIEFVYPLCDGSECPATDVDEDNICDDCGNVFANPRDYTKYKTYGKVTLPDIDTVWSDHTIYPAMAIYQNKTSGEYHLVFGNSYVNDYIYNEDLFENKDQCYFKIGENYYHYKLNGTTWELVESGNNSVVCRTALNDLIWTTAPIYSDATRKALFFHKASPLVNSLTVETAQGVTAQILTILPIGMVCLVGYLGLRKGLKILGQTLSKA